LDVFAEILNGRAEDHASDASEAIDANFNHDVFCFVFEFLSSGGAHLIRHRV
jgi:hypothetical protein